ncbi:MAG: PEGA domain-containing protein [Acidobacteriota bacterium]|nr:PEGA domain-containing protein [Acidobacteriota bacterium]
MGSEATLDHVGRYKIIGEVGKGAMGVVYKATDPTIGRTVALKTMRVDVHGIEAEEMLQRFRNEAKAAGVMNHSNIVTIYDAGEQDGLFYIAMECIEGVTLHRQLADKRVIAVDKVVEYSRQVCAGLDYAHSHGVVHRDIKPANIMIEAGGTVKIMDFGIAKSGGQGMTTVGQVLGTPNYMSPEQVKGRPLDGRSDLFSFGVILYEMVTGERPFTGQNVTTIVYKIVHENPIPPRDLDVTIHPGLSWIITKALSKSPDDRFQKGADLVQALESYKAYGPAGEPTTGVATRSTASADMGQAAAMAPDRRPAATDAKKKASSGWGLFAGAAAVALLLVLAGLAYVRHRINALAEPTAQQQTTAAPQTNPPPAGKPQASQPAGSQPAVGQTASPASGTTAAAKPASKPPEKKPVGAPKEGSQPNSATSAPLTRGQKGAPGSGEMRLTSSPSGARVQIDGWTEPNWITPFNNPSMAAGKHTVVFSKTGYITQTRTVEVAAGRSLTLQAQLPVSVSTLAVSSDPAGAAILVDGKETGRLTPAQIAVDKGEHKIVVRKAGFADAGVTAQIKEGERFEFAPKLQPGSSGGESTANKLKSFFGGIPAGKGQVDVHSDPRGAVILVNGRPYEKKAPTKLILDPGTYSLVLKLEGYKPVQATVIVQEGKKVPFDQKLEKQ